MSQKIKKHIKRSMPLFMIISLVMSSVALGLVFNFDISVYRLGRSGGDLELALPAAEAAKNIASTTVQVKNAPPYFTSAPAESPASIATSPVNYSGEITFTATAADDENNQYYLIVCATNAVIASTTGGEPACGGTELCVSSAVDAGDANQCTFSPVEIAGETQAWYAFVCDSHSTEADCSGANQGSGDSASPFYINHAPTIQEVSASVDFQAPGGTFTFTATSTDGDNARSGDELKLFICDDGGWTEAGGCTGTTYCSSTMVQAVSNEAVNSCDYTDTAPTPDQAYTVYAYIYDEFQLAGNENGTTTTYTIINVAPMVNSVTLVPNSGTEILISLKGGTTVVTASSTNISDQNGCADIQAATGTVYWSGAADGHNCVDDDNNCYQIAETQCEIINCSGATAEAYCTTTLEYIAVPTDASSFYAATSWLAAISVRDEAAYGTAATVLGSGDDADLITNTGLDVPDLQIDYGQLVAGLNSGTSTATTTVENIGNSPIDSDMTGTWMSQGSYTFGEEYQEFATSSNFQWGTGRDLSSTTAFTLDLDIARPTNVAVTVSDYVYWGIGIPAGQMSGVYTGVNTYTVAVDPDGTW